jgi:hypothetical protein
MGRYLGHWSAKFEELWTRAFAVDAIPPEAMDAMMGIHDFPEFRVPARSAVLAAFPSTGGLRELVLGFSPILPVIPWDLTEHAIDRALIDRREFMTNFLAFVDRCQLLYSFLNYAANCAESASGLERVAAGMRRWFTPSEAKLYVEP